jgi:succinyl-CoA synthetase beta subunit
MDLLEYQGKQLLARHGIPMQAGRAVTTVDDAVQAAGVCGYPVVVKAQVRTGGRGKAGGIKLARDAGEVAEHAAAILGMEIKGCVVRELWVGAALPIADEYYASVVFDRRAKAPLVMLSRQGGVEIETVAESDPDALATLHVDPLLGFQPFHGRRLAFEAGIAGDLVGPVGDFLAKLYATFVGEEASLVEVNPLVVTPGDAGVPGERELVALDAKVTLDDNALFRHPENAALRDSADDDPQERMARARGLTYVKLDGDIGILGNGAGLVMSTLDLVALHGGAPANFLDAGGGSKASAIAAAVEVILSNPRVKAVLFNIFGGITRCDEVARGLIGAFAVLKPDVPFVVRLDGTNGVEGRALLAASDLPNLHSAETMDEAAELVVRLARGGSAASREGAGGSGAGRAGSA